MKLSLPPILETKLADFRRRVWRIKLAEAFLSAAAGLLLSYLLVFVCDRFTETPEQLRMTVLMVGCGMLLLWVPYKWYRWVWCQRRLEDAARLLKRTFPRLGDQLLGMVELANQPQGTSGRSERLIQAAMDQAAEAVKDRDFGSAVPEARHLQWAGATAALMVFCGALVVWSSDAAANAFARWLTPWRSIERYTFTRIEPLPRQLVVPFSEPFSLPVHLAPDSQRAPGLGEGGIGRQPLITGSLTGNVYPFAFPPQRDAAELRLAIGDLRKSIRVEPRQRPELSELAVRIALPPYLQYRSDVRMDVRGGSVHALRGAHAAFEAKIQRAVASATLDDQPLATQEDRILTPLTEVTRDTSMQLQWKDSDGLTPRDPLVLKIQATEDQAPRITAQRDSTEQIVLDSEVLAFDISTTDDFGIRAIGLEWKGITADGKISETVQGVKIAAAGEPEKRELSARATFSAAREGIAPQKLQIRAWVTDYLPEREKVYSPPFVVQVLNKSDHALWLVEQFGKWMGAARKTYDREQQLHQNNRELRQLDAAELDRPENRKRVSQQAAAENTNAARLDALTGAGRNLIQQATRNDEFDAQRLELWASMMKSLKDISGARMPSVANLLKQSANSGTAAQSRSTAGAQPTSSTAQSQAHPSASPASPPNASSQSPPSAPTVSQGQASQQNATASAPSASIKPPVPGISDRESSLSVDKNAEQPPSNSASKPGGGGKLSLPQTQLGAAPGTTKNSAPEPESPAQERMDKALEEQKNLLEEFARVSDELNKLLGNFEASTFVKRLKAASRKQLAIAKSVTQKTLSSFGVSFTPPPEAEPIAENAMDQGEFVRLIQTDLDAFVQRKQDTRYNKLLADMKQTRVTERLLQNSGKLLTNLSGQTVSSAEFWADTLDRWSEELVSASQCKSCNKSKSDESLPPEVILKVMKALQREIQLRDQTREAENAKAALNAQSHSETATSLATAQGAIATLTSSAISDVLSIPDALQKFSKELKMLEAVVNVMQEAESLLKTPDTGVRPVAAETEAIELLLQAKRANPKGGGGGGGSSPGGGGTAAFASSAALADIGAGNADQALSARPVGQATGQAGREFPAEFKTGLDAYFNLLEGGRK